MTRTCRARRVLSLGLGVLAFAMGDAHAQVAEPSVAATAITWRPLVENEGFTLTVAGPERVVRRELLAGEQPTFELVDAQGKRRPDGGYTWELRAIPPLGEDERQRLLAARASGDDERAEQLLAELQAAGTLPAEGALVQTGSFAIAGGAFVALDGAEPEGGAGSPARPSSPARRATASDQVIPDDLIVRDDACIGFDCVDNESFGLDTLRLKENNLRIHFDDTSTFSGFPRNDWRIIANGAESGGASKLSIEDATAARTPFTISAGAPSNSIFADSTGRVGLRTATPVLDLHVTTRNTPALRLEQTSAGGFTAQTWDIGANEANFFVRDVTGGSKLSFRIRPGAPTSSIDVAGSGRVGIGTGSPDYKLDVAGPTGADATLAVTSTSFDGNPVALLRREGNPQPGQVVGVLGFGGAAGLPAVDLTAMAEEAWSPAAHGAGLFVATTEVGSARAVPRLVVRGQGFVGIGTAQPREKLEVFDGNILVTGGSFIADGVTLNVPDYVFEAGYERMPLDELAAYVAREKHLPDVPDRDEVAASGLDLSAFQMRLLAKVEELFLHAIEQHRAIDSLGKENAALNARLAALEAAPAAPAP
jgi:hypothetical protein